MSGSATFTTVMSSRSMNIAVQTAIRVHHLRSRAGIGGVYRAGVPARTMCRDRRIRPHHRNRRPHPALRRLLRGGGGGEGRPGRPERDRQVVLHLGAGGRARRRSCATGATSGCSAPSATCPRPRCPAGWASSPPASPTSSRPAASTSSTTPWARPARPWPTTRRRRTSSCSPTCRSKFQSNGGYEAESVMARLADGLGLRQELLLEDID